MARSAPYVRRRHRGRGWRSARSAERQVRLPEATTGGRGIIFVTSLAKTRLRGRRGAKEGQRAGALPGTGRTRHQASAKVGRAGVAMALVAMTRGSRMEPPRRTIGFSESNDMREPTGSPLAYRSPRIFFFGPHGEGHLRGVRGCSKPHPHRRMAAARCLATSRTGTEQRHSTGTRRCPRPWRTRPVCPLATDNPACIAPVGSTGAPMEDSRNRPQRPDAES